MELEADLAGRDVFEADLVERPRREELRAVVCAHGDLVLDARLADFVDDGVDAEGEVDVFCCAVAHQLEFAVGRHERRWKDLGCESVGGYW